MEDVISMRKISAAAFALGMMGCPPSVRAQGVYGNDVAVSFTPAVQNLAYSTGNALGPLQTIMFFRSPAFSGIMDQFGIGSKGGSTVAITVYVFDTLPVNSTCTDKVAFSLANADIAKLAMAPFVLTPSVVGSGSTQTFAQLTQTTSVRNQDAPRTANLYVCLVTNGTVTPASTSDLIGKISGLND